MKKILCFLVLVLTCFCLIACGTTNDEGFKPVAKEDIKIGLICLHDESSTYDANFIDSMYRALEELNIPRTQLELVTGVGENNECYEKASELAISCNVIFADSFGHEDFMIQAAQAKPNVRFCHATGEKAALVNLPNYSNAFASIYEGRYLAGIAAGLKLNEINKDKEVKNYKIGYVGAFPYAEVISGYTSFYLGVRSVCPEVTMEVRYTSTWYDFDLEYAAANALIVDGCALISQHADSYGAPQACEEAGIPNVSYNGSTALQCPNTYVISSKIDWAPYFKYMINQVIAGEPIATDWTGTIETDSVKLTATGSAAAEGTDEAIDIAKAKFANGTLKVFDLSTFTIGGQNITSYMANVIPDSNYEDDTDVVKTVGEISYIAESEFRSAPYFAAIIDGITILGDN